MSLTFEEYVRKAHDKGYSREEIAQQVDLLRERGYFDGDGLDLEGEIPQVTDMAAYRGSIRNTLEGELERLNAERAKAQEELEFAEKSPLEKGVAGLAQAGNTAAQYVARPILDAPAALWNTTLRQEGQPMLEGILPELGASDNDYVPEGTPGRVASELGADMMLGGMSFAPVARVQGKTGSVMADVFGIGATDEAMAIPGVMTARNAPLPATAQAPELTGLARDKEMMDFNNADMVQDAVQEINIRAAADAVDQHMDTWQRAQGKSDKFIKKTEEAIDKRMATSEARHGRSFGEQHNEEVIESFARMYDLDRAEAAGIIYRSGGVDGPQSFADLVKLRNKGLTEDLFTSTQDKRRLARYSEGLDPSKYSNTTFKGIEEWVRPAIGLIRDNIGEGMANKVEAAMVRGAARRDYLVTKYTESQDSVQRIAEWADKGRIKRQFMNLHKTGVEGRAKLIGEARKALDAGDFQTFMDIIDDTHEHQKRVQKHLMRKDQKRDAVHWGIAKTGDRPAPGSSAATAARAGDKEPANVGQLQKRVRADADKMSDEKLAEYDNPIFSNFNQLFDSEDLVEMAKELGMPAGMVVGKGGGQLQQFVNNLVRHIGTTTGDMNKANNAAKIMDSIIVGSRKQVGPWQQAFMNQAYAGTLGHVKSALLQTHDQFINAWRTSPTDTLKALFQREGVKPSDFGLATNAFNTREFREGADAGFEALMRGTETTGQKAARKTADLAQEIFQKTGFQAIDRWGKGTNLKATHRNMQRLAKKDMRAFTDKYGNLFTRQELAEIREPLKRGAKWEDMTDRQRRILGTGLIARLGQQQLISSASRPLAYLDNPNLRWGWAMRGFALVQSDLLKAEVIDRARAGDMAGAGNALAQWSGWVVGGYVISDTIRDVAGAGVSGAMADPFTSGPRDEANAMDAMAAQVTPEKMRDRVFEGYAGPLSFNTVGDRYSVGKVEREGPADTLMQTLNPPTGMVGTALEAVGNAGFAMTKPGADLESVSDVFLTDLSALIPGVGREIRASMKLHQKEDKAEQMRSKRRTRRGERDKRRRERRN
jgi:hypothetical protein